jgi:putative tributyrin esterase
MVVMPDGGRGFYCDAAEGFQYGTAIGIELSERIDRTFPTIASRSGRAVAGLSMGGYGAIRLGLTYPDRFCAAVSHSGALAFGHRATTHDGKPNSPEFQRILGPDPAGGSNDLFALVEAEDRKNLPALRIDCGTDDFLIESNREFHAHLTKIGVPHEYEEHPGAHTWGYWDEHIQETLRFVSRSLG